MGPLGIGSTKSAKFSLLPLHLCFFCLLPHCIFPFFFSNAKMKTLQFPHQIQVLKSAAISRFFLLSLIVIWRSLLSPYDTSASLNPNCLADRRHTQQSPNSSIGSKIENGIVWDSVYFVRIAQCGYEYEQTYAFLPLLPACIRLISRTGKMISSGLFFFFFCFLSWEILL